MVTPEITNPADIDPAIKRQFFSDLALSAISAMRIHGLSRQIGMSSHVGTDEAGRPKRWGDPTQHCLVEAAASQVLGNMLGLSAEDQAAFTTAALVHDASKRPEIEAVQQAKAAGKTAEEIDAVNDEAYAASKERLRAAGVGSKAVALTEAVAHTSLDQFVMLQSDNALALREDVPVVYMAMHYLDDITLRTNIVNFDARIDMLEEVAAERYPYNEAGRAVWGGRTYFEAQRETGHLIEARLAEIAGIEDPSTLPDAINRGLVQLITSG